MSVAVVAHCDWSMEQKKRWMAVAIKRGGHWHVQPSELVGDTSSLVDRLQRRAVHPGALLIGFDFPIGLPEAYARAAGIGSFREALTSFGSGIWSDWYNVADHRDHISLQRPFYLVRPGGTARAHLFDALGVTDASSLLRVCERATADRQAACMLFWTLGGNQVGKGAISGWREIIVPRLDETVAVRWKLGRARQQKASHPCRNLSWRRVSSDRHSTKWLEQAASGRPDTDGTEYIALACSAAEPRYRSASAVHRRWLRLGQVRRGSFRCRGWTAGDARCRR